MRISLCTTSMNRLHQIRETLPANLADHRDDPHVEFLLLDYSSTDGLEEWVHKECADALASGRLVFAQLAGRDRFHMAHAKNVSHRAATGDILCNLDADNFTGANFAAYLRAEFRKPRETSFLLRSLGPLGTRGRIALRRDDFLRLGGYDEAMNLGWGYEDCDLVKRAKRLGIRERLIQDDPATTYLRVIPHPDDERTQHYAEKDRRTSHAQHKQMSEENLRRGLHIANQGRHWAQARLKIRGHFYDI